MLELNMTTVVFIMGVLVFLTNAIVEVIKQVFSINGEKAINKVALGVAMLLTVVSYFIYIGYTSSKFIWYYLVGASILGFIVALVAMLGWDKVLKMWQQSKREE